MDVVPANPETWERDPFKLTVEGDRLFGRGTTDCLGHVALMTTLFSQIAELKPKLKTSLTCVFIASEEASGPSIDELQAKIEDLEAQVAAKHDQALRSLAEAENARRRASIDVENAHKFAVGKFAKSLLDVADNLGRAADSVPEEAIAENEQLKMLHEGVTMTSTMLLKTFEQHGLQRVDPLGEKFDPNLHNALFEVPDPAQEPGTIAHVQNYGYSLHDRVIRPADVGIVAKR